MDGQLGLEKTPEEFVAKMVEIFAEVWRVLKPEGTLWLNLGDSYAGGKTGRADSGDNGRFGGPELTPTQRKPPKGLKQKDLVGIPWMVAFALRDAGWYLRQDIIWHKPNPMPESVRDRCTKAHEYIFLLTKQPKYYCDMEAIKEKATTDETTRPVYGAPEIAMPDGYHDQTGRVNGGKNVPFDGKRNKRSVWTVTTKPYSEAHFATFPPDLIEPCILAGCPEWVCKKCGKARERIIERSGGTTGESWHDHENDIGIGIGQTRNGVPLSTAMNRKMKENPYKVETTGWTDCGCGAGFSPGVVLDPFMGSGTTAMVAYENRRNYIGCELNPEYIKLNRADKAKEKYGLFEG